MATEVDFDQAGGKLRARVALDRNAGTWRQIPRPGWARNYPAFGVYVEKLNEGEHLFMFGSAEDPDRDDIPITILRNFFRPKTGKQGMGHAGHLKMKVPGGPVTWTVVNCDQAEAGIAALSFERKCELDPYGQGQGGLPTTAATLEPAAQPCPVGCSCHSPN